MFTNVNIYSMSNKTDHISEKYIFLEKKVDIFPILGWDPDPLFHETNPRIRINIKMKPLIYLWSNSITVPLKNSELTLPPTQ